MSDAREYLTNVGPGPAWWEMRNALLAVLDECNRIDHDAEQMLYQFGPGDYYEGLMMGLTTSASNVRRAINKALGVTDD